MKYIIIITLVFSILHATQTQEQNSTKENSVITIKDTSGLSEKEISNIAIKSDQKKQSKNNKTVYTWEKLAPTPVNFDWLELKSGEWLKGRFKAYQDNVLEFDSNKMKLLDFDFKDVFQLRTHKIMTVNIQIETNKNSSSFFTLENTKLKVSGIIRLNRKTIRIIQGENTLEFPRQQIISIAHNGEKELNYWSGKVTINYNQQIGNSDQLDFTTQAKIQRRTATTRLHFTYLGNISNKKNENVTNNHRLKGIYDIFITRKFFATAFALEYYRDPYQNIAQETTTKVAAGYTIARNPYIEWDVSGGPAKIRTIYETVKAGENKESNSLALQFNTRIDIDITKNLDKLLGYKIIFKDIDLLLDYQFTFTDKISGNYKHHMSTKLENKLTSWLDLDITFIWDYLHSPTPREDGSVPLQDDYQFLIGLGIDF